MSANREKGPVKWFDKAKGYGFITRDTDQGPEDVFVHYNAIRGEGFRLLYEGQIVEYSLQKGPKGLQADEVTLVDGSSVPQHGHADSLEYAPATPHEEINEQTEEFA